ncbi:MAG: CBS domain-containing protein [Ignavibacteriaceae bacterium]
MSTIRKILEMKGGEVWSVTTENTVYDALSLMAEKSIGAVMVIDNNTLKGVMSERDYARKIILEGKSSKDVLVGEIMSPRVIYVDVDTDIEECMALMINKRIRHLPVYENDGLTGIISIGDVVKALIDEKVVVINELENYITGRR